MTSNATTKLILENQLAILWALYDMREVLGARDVEVQLELERRMTETRNHIFDAKEDKWK